MKKFALPMVIALLLSAFAFTGCDTPFIAPENEWYSMETEVAGQDVELYFYYTSEDTEIKYQSKVLAELKPGFTVIVTLPDLETSITKQPYYLYTFETGKEVPAEEFCDEDDEQKNGFKFKATMWDALYIGKYKTDFKNDKPEEIPYALIGGASVSSFVDLGKEVGKDFSDFSWKDIIVGVLDMV